jgi:hypothetical protein
MGIFATKSLGSTVANFSPLSLNPQYWYDATRIESFVLSGSNITTWADVGGNGRTATSGGSTAARPTINTDTLNGYRVASLDNRSGGSKYFDPVSLNINGTTLTLFSVHKNTPAASGGTIYGRPWSLSPAATEDFSDQSGCNLTYGFAGTAANPGVTFSRQNVNICSTPTFTAGTWHVIAAVRNGTNCAIWLDGGNKATGTTGATAFNATRIRIGNNQQRVDCGMYGAIAETMLFTQALSDTDVDKINGYLAWKWGLQANLPTAHPYKNSSP